MSEDTVVSRIRGVRGTPVKLKIERRTGKAAQLNRDNAYKVFDITLTRDIIEVRPVKLEWLPNRIAWLRVDEFNKKTDAEMGEAMASLRKGPNNQGMAKGLFSTCATIPVVCSMSPWMLALASFRRPHRLHP
jgi:C-terminal processing protease CtpA/Prc